MKKKLDAEYRWGEVAAALRGAAESKAVRDAGRGMLFLLSGAVLGCGDLGYGAAPMGFAFLAAVGTEAPFTAVGVIAAAILSGRHALLPALTALLLTAVRFALPVLWEKREKESAAERLRDKLYGLAPSFREPWQVRLALLELALFTVGIGRLIGDGMLYYDLFGLLIAMGTAPFFLFAFLSFLDRSAGASVRREFGQTVFLLGLVLSFRGTAVFGFDLAALTGFFLTLTVSAGGGSLRGGIFGILAGLTVSPVAGAAFCLAGMTAGAVRRIGKGVPTVIGVLTASVFFLWQGGVSALISLLPDTVAAGAIRLPFSAWAPPEKKLTFSGDAGLPEEIWNAHSVEKTKAADRNDRSEAIAEAFRTVSGVFSELSEKMKRPDLYEIRGVVDRTYDKFCSRCPLSTNCWVREHDATHDAMIHIADRLYKNASVTEADVPRFLADRCRQTPKIVRELRLSLVEVLETAAKNDRLSLLAFDYGAIGKLLTESYAAEAKEEEPDPRLAARIRKAAAILGLNASAVSVFGRRRLTVVAGGIDLARAGETPEKIRAAMENVCHTALSLPDFDVSGDFVTMTLRSERKYTVTSASAGVSREEETVNGDSAAAFEGKDDYFYFLISDGMGSGKDAALTSGMCVTFLRTMLEAGTPLPVVLEMLSQFLRAKTPECFATVDLLRIDLLSGDASFFKSGAAPSYVLREGRLFKLSSRSMPIGISGKLNTERIDFSLESGDTVVMISDGVAVGFEDSLALADVLTYRYTAEDTPETMCRKILVGADTAGHDDMTVGMITVEELVREKEKKAG